MYTNDSANNPIWYVITNCPVVAGGCTGDIFRVRGGSPLTASWAPNLALTKVGSGTLAFSDANTAAMNFTIDGIAGSKAITRQVFASPPVQTGGFPITFKSLRINSVTVGLDRNGYCKGYVSVTNLGTKAVGFANLVFNVRVGNFAPTEQSIFGSSTAPGVTEIYDGFLLIGAYSCSTVTLEFNPAQSSVC